MIPTLRKFYSDSDLFKMAKAAMNLDETSSIGNELEDAFVQLWVNGKKTPDEVLVHLGLDRTTITLLENPLLSTFTKFVDAYSVKYPEKKTTVIEMFTQAFGDEIVAKMLVVAKSNDATRSIATKQEAAHLEMWRRSGESADNVFYLLKLHITDHDFSHSPIFSTWISYMNTVVNENPGKASTLFSTLETRFSDRPLVQILEAAKKYPSMESIATKMQTEKIQGIFASKKSPEDIFAAIGLADKKDNLLVDPLFKEWLNYVKVFNKENPRKQESWFMPLRRHYEWDGVENMIEKGMQNPCTVRMATMVETAWLKEWLQKWKTLPKQAFHSLNLYKVGDSTLSTRRFKVWAKYLNDFNQRYPDKRTSMIDGLRANLRDRDLIRIFGTAKKDSKTENLATNLQNALINKWVVEKKSPTYLKSAYVGEPGIDEMLQLYTKKLNAVSHNHA